MPLYKYQALDKFGLYKRGQINAANEIDLEKRLIDIGLDLIDYSHINVTSKAFGSNISSKELILFCIQLEQLEKAGVPLLDALNDMRDTAETTQMKNLLADICESIKNGAVLSKSLANHPKVFNDVFCGLIATGEKTGQLSIIFSHLANHLRWISEIKGKIKKASYYPIFLLLIMCAIVALMMLFVVPKLSVFLTSQNFELPFSTKALIATSEFFQNYWYLVFGGPIILTIVVKIAVKLSKNFAYLIDKIKISLPVLGSIINKIEIARFCRFFAITYQSGIGIMDCLDISNNVVHNLIIKQAIRDAKENVNNGISLTNSLKQTNRFPSLVIRMIKVGEDGGNLDETLSNVNYFYDKEVNDEVNRLLGLIQPTLTILMGTMMLWITMAVFGPLYSSFSKMSF